VNAALYCFARVLLALLEALPLAAVARLGRFGGWLAHGLDARHRRVTAQNLAAAFPEKSNREIQHLAKENFKRIGEGFACAVKTASMSDDEIRKVVTVCGAENFLEKTTPTSNNFIFAVGHFGNFEVYARCSIFVPGYQFATTYRALRQPSLNRLMQSLRERSGCLFFERRSGADALKTTMNKGRIILGLLADQHAGNKGLWLPFFGRECSTSAAPAVFALRYDCPLFVAICFRTAPGRWRIDVSPEIPTHENGRARSTSDIMRDVNHVLEQGVRRDPANWFWVHNRWKPRHTGHKMPVDEAKAALPAEDN
jgi:lauroyl/myristoyl acyltransferase